MIDSHCHLDRLACTPEAALDRAEQSGVHGLLLPGVDRAGLARCASIASRHPQVRLAAGIHPDQALEDSALEQPLATWLREQARSLSLAALGETGLDFSPHHERGPVTEAERKVQMESFRTHLRLSLELDLPVIVHTRGAREETLELLPEGAGGVIHCFTEDLAFANRALELGYLISLSGIVTFRSADALRSVVRELPLEGLLVETDAPWLAPVPLRGKSNEPAFVTHTAACVADLKGVSVAELTACTDANFQRLFGA